MMAQTFPSLLIENYDYCLTLSKQEFVLYNWNDNKITFGKGTPQNYEGKEIRFVNDSEVLKVRKLFIGHV